MTTIHDLDPCDDLPLPITLAALNDDDDDCDTIIVDLARQGDIAAALSRADRWHLRPLRQLTDRILEVRALFDAEISRLQARRDDLIAPLNSQAGWHERQLIQLHRAILDVDPTRKTLTLPNGTVKSRTASTAKVEIVDTATFTGWAREHAPDLLRVTYAPDRARLNAADSPVIITGDGAAAIPAHDTGELHAIPGTTVIPAGTTTFTVRPDLDETSVL